MFKRSLLSLVMILSCATAQASDVDATNTGRVAAVREFFNKGWNSETVAFAAKMINPLAYGKACKAMYEAGFKNALSTVYAKHTPVVAGTVVLTAAAVAAVAYYQGWFAKAKTWVSSKLG